MPVRIPYTSYNFQQPLEPLTEAQYDNLRNLSDPQFKEQLKQAKKEAGREFRTKFIEDCKFFLILLASGIGLVLSLELFAGIDKYGITDAIAGIIGIILVLAFFGTLYSSILSSSSNFRFIKDFGKFMKDRRRDVLRSQSYSEYLDAYRSIKNHDHGR